MKRKAYLQHEPYQGVRLTAEGERIAMPALRRHRLVEVFLVQVMEFGWGEAHELSDRLELGINETLEDRIDVLTGHPTRCPHGEPIPSKEGRMPEVNDIPLVNLDPTLRCRISRVRTHDVDKLRYFADLGLVPGVALELRSRAPFDGPLRIQMNSEELVLGYELASALYVEPLTAPPD
jgi:DtxR family Mn-dependent transcriptional regulator